MIFLVGCVPSTRVPATTTPQGNSFLEKGVTLGMGIELTEFASLTENGESRPTGYGPRRKIPLLQLLSFSARDSFSENCDVGVQLRAGSLGGDVRCGLGDEDKTLAISTGADFRWWHGLVGRTELQAGAHKDGFLAFATTGVTYGTWKHAIGLDQDDSLNGLLLGPEEPYVRVAQQELAWSSSATIGFPIALEGDGPAVFLSFSVDRPVLTSTPEFSCVGCTGDRVFSDFDPGFRLGGMIGVTATR